MNNLEIKGSLTFFYYNDLEAASRFYGDTLGFDLMLDRQWVKIYQANLGTIQNPNKLYPGQELFVIVEADWEPPFDLDEYVETWRPALLSGSTP